MQDNKKIKLLITILILLLCISIIKFIITKIENYDPVEQEMKAYGYENLGISENPQEDQKKEIEFNNITVLKELKGSLQISTVIEKVEKTFLEEIPKVLDETKNMSHNQILKYYTDNMSDIRNNLNIDNQKSFLNMLEKLDNITCDIKTDYQKCEFSADDTLKLIFYYNNNEKIECNIVGEHANLIMFEF